MPKENAEQITTRLRDIEHKAREIEDAKSRIDILVTERTAMLAQLKACCPHTHLIESKDGMREYCDDCDGRGGKHPARLCEDCGDYESACPLYSDDWYRLDGEVKIVSTEEFNSAEERLVLR